VPIRNSGHRPGMSLRFEVESCRGCGRRRAYFVRDVRPDLVVFECPRCGRDEELRVSQMIRLSQQDQERVGRRPAAFRMEKELSGGSGLAVPGGWRLRLLIPSCPGCNRRGEYWLKDVYDTGPLFSCPDCDAEWHLHLEQIVPFAIADHLVLGRAPDRVLERLTARLVPESDRRPDEAFAALREETLRRGHHPRELPWNATAR